MMFSYLCFQIKCLSRNVFIASYQYLDLFAYDARRAVFPLPTEIFFLEGKGMIENLDEKDFKVQTKQK